LKRYFLLDGTEVILHGKLENQFIVEVVLEDYEGEEYFSGEKIFVDSIFEEPLTEKLNSQIVSLKNDISKLNNEIYELNNEKEKCKKEIIDMDKLSFLKELKNVNVNNIESFIKILGFKPMCNFEIVDKDYRGYNNIYKYESLIYKYYDNKKELIALFDFLGIKIKKEYRELILPKDMSIDEVRNLIENKKFITVNSSYLRNNEEYFISDFISRKKYALQDILKHKDIMECFDLFLKFYLNNDYGVWEFHTIIPIEEKEVNIIIDKVVENNRVNRVGVGFINKYKDIIFSNEDFCKKAFEYISDNKFSEFYISNFPLKYQAEYFKSKGIKETIKFLSDNYNAKNFEEGHLEIILKEICK
jgi:hypothetical protein